ncbi:MAG: hypothetical protein ORO03_02330, partial [Alphaproteobacteria bacterium]|nr:hypothetical protein [Alphaproteobacteria bacterium]
MTVAIRDLNRAGFGKSLAFLFEFFKLSDMSGWITRNRSVGDSRARGSVRSEPQPIARQRLRRLRLIIWCGAATLGIVLWCAIWFLLDQTRRYEMNQALKDLQHLDHAFGASSIRWLGDIEVTLKNFEQSLLANRSRGQWLEQQQIQLGISGSRNAGLPISQAMAAEGEGESLAPIDYRYIDRQGLESERIVVGHSPPRPALASRLARPSELSRDYFQFHADSESESTYVSRPWRDIRTGQWRLNLSRRVNDRDGGFAGVVVATLDPNFLSRLFRAMDVGGLNSVFLLGDDGVVRLDSKSEYSLAGLDISNTMLFQGIRASHHLNSGHRTPAGSLLNPHNQWLGEDPISGAGKA